MLHNRFPADGNERYPLCGLGICRGYMTTAIVGAASTTFGEHEESSARELFETAVQDALEMSSVELNDLDAVYVGNFMGGLTDDQGHMGAMMADHVGVPSMSSLTVESACASSGAAIHLARHAIEAGRVHVALVGGVEIMLATGIEEITDALANAADNEYENEAGLTFPGIYALMARAYMNTYDVTREELAAVAVKNRRHGVTNPISQFRDEITVDDVLDARPISPPLGLFDCCPVSDGASAIVLTNEEFATDRGITPEAKISGSAQAGDSLTLQDRTDIARTRAAETAARKAYEDAGISPDDVDVCEVHDCFTIAELFAIESLGFCDPGDGADLTAAGETGIGGQIPVNPSGGLLSKGHPVGATGVAQVVEITKQLSDRHPNQVPDARIGVAHNVGGSGASAVIHVLEAPT